MTFMWVFLLKSLQGQVVLKNSSLTSPDSALLYIYVDNILEITGVKYDNTIKVSSTNSELKKINGKITLIPKLEGNDTVRLYKGKNKLIEKVFKVAHFETPIVQIAATKDSILYPDKILNTPFVSIIIPHSIYKCRTTVYGYTLEIKAKRSEPKFFSCSSSEIPKDALHVIKALKAGDELLFTGIKGGIGPSFCPKTFGDRRIIIK
jgi:hypothetical protein